MELHDLQHAEGAVRNEKRIGRGPGSGTGKTSGKGHKGQKARSGYNYKAQFEGGQMPLFRRFPKRGFHHSKRHPMAIINVEMLDQHFETGAAVTTQDLVDRHIVHSKSGGVKILGKGEVTKALHVKVQAISPGAQSKIEAAGGSVEIIAMVSNAPTAVSGGAEAPKE